MSVEIRGFEYDIALSFAGENREIVEQFATLLKARDVRVFYDNWEQSNLWGKDLYQHLDDLYRRKARYCIIFVSKPYAEKAWTQHELRSAQTRAFRDNEEYILPVRLDDTDLPGIRETVGYVDCRKTSIAQLAELTLSKLGKNLNGLPSDDAKPPGGFRIPRIPKPASDPAEGANTLLRHLESVLDPRFESLKEGGLTTAKLDGSGPCIVYRVWQGNRLLFYVSIRVTEIAGNHVLAFKHGWNEGENLDGMTAFARIETSLDQPRPFAKVNDFSLFEQAGFTGTMSFDQVADGIWEKACSVIESLINRR